MNRLTAAAYGNVYERGHIQIAVFQHSRSYAITLVGEVQGDKVKKGDTLCLIEAMKLMNEVVAERDGEVVEVCVDNGIFNCFKSIII